MMVTDVKCESVVSAVAVVVLVAVNEDYSCITQLAMHRRTC